MTKARTNFKAVLAEYDKQVGRLIAGLKELGLETNTIVIFASDNGPLPTFNGTRTGGLRGAKDSLYEGGTREPLIVRWPGHVPAGRVDSKSVIGGVDFLPMFCQLGGRRRLPDQKAGWRGLEPRLFRSKRRPQESALLGIWPQ